MTIMLDKTGDGSSIPPQSAGRFEVKKLLGEGGFGLAYLAIDPMRKDEHRSGEVVLKCLKPEFRYDENLISDFQRSFRRAQALHHTNICALYELGNDTRLGVFHVMQYVQGITLDSFIKKHTTASSGLSLAQILPWLRQIAQALDAACKSGLVHCDVSPGNIMLNESTGHLTVLDFGLAADVRNSMSQRKIAADRPQGTPLYMAPEQWQANPKELCAATDQYALAVVTWQMLTGNVPFSSKDYAVLKLAVLQEQVPQLPPHLAALQPVFEKALAKQPQHRYPTVEQFVQALQQPVGTAPPSVKDVATELKRRTELLTSTTQQARALASSGQFTQALQLLDALPAGLQSQRNSDVYQQCLTGQARVQLLIGQLHTAVQETHSIRVRSLLTELQQLQPGEAAWRNQLDELKSWTPPDQPSPLKAPFDAVAAANGQRLWAQFLRCSVDVQGPLGLRFRLIPPGSFLMGSTETRKDLEAAGFVIPEGISVDDEHPQHAVQLTAPYFLGTTAVTRGQFARFVQATGYLTDAERDGKGGWGYVPSKQGSEQRPEFNWQNTGFEQSDDHPVVNVSYQDAMAFLDWLNGQPPVEGILRRFRLPTEAEWEYACRAGTTTRFWTGDDFASLLGAANVQDASFQVKFPKVDYKKWQSFPFDDGVAFTARCGSFRANPFGLFDMAGNTWDWCSDWYSSAYYAKSPAADPSGPASGSSRVVRGGCWRSGPLDVRAGCRDYFVPDYRDNGIGFRVCSDS